MLMTFNRFLVEDSREQLNLHKVQPFSGQVSRTFPTFHSLKTIKAGGLPAYSG